MNSQHEDTFINLMFNSYKKDSRKYYFSSRVVTDWNALPENVVTAPSINTFKNRLDKFMEKKLYTVYPESDIEGVT